MNFLQYHRIKILQNSDEVKKVLGNAEQIASELLHVPVGTEHVLLALILMQEQGCLLPWLNFDCKYEFALGCYKKVFGGKAEGRLPKSVKYSPRLKKALKRGNSYAFRANQNELGIEYFLLGLWASGGGGAVSLVCELQAPRSVQ